MVVDCILACNPPLLELGDDHLSWEWKDAGVFSMRKTYNQLCCSTNSTLGRTDKLIRKLRTPQRVRTFRWLLIREKILKIAERVRRGMGSYPCCDQRGCFLESSLHVVRDCVVARVA